MNTTSVNSNGDWLTTVVTHVSESEGIPFEELPPLYDTLDTECLTRLLESNSVDVSFSYCGYTVSIEADGDISITPEQSQELSF